MLINPQSIEPMFLKYAGVAGDEQHTAALVETAEGKDGFVRRGRGKEWDSK